MACACVRTAACVQWEHTRWTSTTLLRLGGFAAGSMGIVSTGLGLDRMGRVGALFLNHLPFRKPIRA